MLVKTLTEQELLAAAVNSLRNALPEDVAISIAPASPSGGEQPQIDATLEVDFGSSKTFFEVETSLGQNFATNLSRAISWDAANVKPTVLVTNYIQPSAREIMKKNGQSYIDVTGNVFLYRTNPPVLISSEGAKSDPWAKPGRPITNLKGNPAGLVVRTLLDNKSPISVAEVIEKSGASRGAVYRVLDFLEEASLIERRERGQVTAVKRTALLELWADNYDVLRSNRIKSYVSTRGLDDLKVRLRDVGDAEYAATGSLAAEPISKYAPTYTVLLYTRDIAGLAAKLNLQETEKGADVILIEPIGEFQLKDSAVIDGIRLVPPTQAAADLLNGPGRNPEEGKALIKWLEASDEWR